MATKPKQPPYYTLGSRLSGFREIVGLTQREVGAKVGVTNVHISRIECGHIQPSLPLLERLAKFYKTTVSELTR
jgi:transcriptional regulator with XRE-family HTH domain